MSKLAAEVEQAVRKIPPGKVMTYGGLARLLGRPQAARAVGNCLAANRHPYSRKVSNSSWPCHRVIKGDGSVGGYVDGELVKQQLLLSEGVKFVHNKVASESIID